MLTQFAKVLTQNVLLLATGRLRQDQASRRRSGRGCRRATAARSIPCGPKWASTGPDLGDSSVAAGEREKVAGAQGGAVLRPAGRRQDPAPSAAFRACRRCCGSGAATRSTMPGSIAPMELAQDRKGQGGLARRPGPDATGARRPPPGRPRFPGAAPRTAARTRHPGRLRQRPGARPREAQLTRAGVASLGAHRDTDDAAVAGGRLDSTRSGCCWRCRQRSRPRHGPDPAVRDGRSHPTRSGRHRRQHTARGTSDAITAAREPAQRYHDFIVVDRVVAVVGNRPVLASQVDEETFRRQSQGAKLPTDREGLEAVRQQIVGSIIDEELLVQQAQRDTAIKVTDQEIANGVEEQVRKVRGNFTSEVDYRQRAQEGGVPDAGGVPPLAHRSAAPGGVPEPADREAARRRQAEGGVADRAGDEAVLRRAEGQPRHPAGHHLVPPDRRVAARPSAAAKARARAQADSIVLELRPRRGLRHRGAALLPGPGIEGAGRIAQLVPPRA